MEIEDLKARLSRIPVAILSDVLRHAGAPHQVLHHSIAAIGRGTVAGPAFCVGGERVLGGTPKNSVNLRYEMYRRLRPGSVVLLASDGYEDAVVFGENVALALKLHGCAAIVTDGGIRDRDAMEVLGIPVYARFVTPLSAGGQWTTTSLDEPIVLPGQSSAFVSVSPGDWVMADSDGVVIVPRRGIATVTEDAELVLEAETRTREALQSGQDPEQAYGAFKRFDGVRPLPPQKGNRG